MPGPRDLAQNRRVALSRSIGDQGLRPAGHRGQIAVAHPHLHRQFLQGEAVPPGRSPELALRFALARSLFRTAPACVPWIFLAPSCGGFSLPWKPMVGWVIASVMLMLVIAFMSLPPKHRKRGRPRNEDDPTRFQDRGFSVIQLSVAAHPAVFGCRLVTRRGDGPRGRCQFTGSSNRSVADWMTLPRNPPAPDALLPRSETTQRKTPNLGGCPKTQFGQGLGAVRPAQCAWRRAHYSLGLAPEKENAGVGG